MGRREVASKMEGRKAWLRLGRDCRETVLWVHEEDRVGVGGKANEQQAHRSWYP